ncbi:SDR family NAD(P)-dependent oxidoreductase [Rhizobium redzepovicii]|uniref:SDR family NAD(P)-dependent oxidoreductase n=1 Tax=Rhizobium redzepovicii TaxID=2867518 RepID=A0AAW8P0Q2_9HYPH|nr:SDR family NAD(P)-dependent oxidoreductase [Rhizobium redzepovicii]MDR9760075.1 SDR family NAD(P)-dependent oxidoreductase [Rhizobium redzepovicii]
MMVGAVLHMRLHVCAPEMKAQIVSVTSVEAFTANPQNAQYAATKAAVVILTKSLCAGMRQGSDRCQIRRATVPVPRHLHRPPGNRSATPAFELKTTVLTSFGSARYGRDDQYHQGPQHRGTRGNIRRHRAYAGRHGT